jgi:hypothetical protein
MNHNLNLYKKVNEIVRKEPAFVIQQDYYYQMVNDHKQIYKVKHRETKNSYEFNLFLFLIVFFLPKHQLFQVNMEDIDKVQELHN